MLKNPKVKFYNELSLIILEVEDEGTMIKVDVTDKVIPLAFEQMERDRQIMKDTLKNEFKGFYKPF